MGLRLLKIRLPDAHEDTAREALEEVDTIELWTDLTREDEFELNVLLFGEDTEAAVDALESVFSTEDSFRIVLLAVEASIPRPDPEEEDEESEEEEGEGAESEEEEDDEETAPINIEELFDQVTQGLGISRNYTAMIVLSTLVAAVGLVRDDVAVVIAAMIIAPLLGPNMSLALATTLADRDLARRALSSGMYGIALSAAVAALFGFVVPFEITSERIAASTDIGMLAFVLAGSAGAAGALSFVTDTQQRIVGVMIAVALVPPLVASGMLFGAGHFVEALAAAMLVLSNLICINLTGVAIFYMYNIRPRTAWESERATRATYIALSIWVGMLALLVVLVFISEQVWGLP